MADKQIKHSSLSIDLGGVQKRLLSLDAHEYFSRPFELKIDMLAEHGQVDLLPHLGKPTVVTVREDNEILRYFHGILVDGELIMQNEDQSVVYRLTLRPKAWLHEQGRYFRIFQNKSVRQIIQQMLEERGIKAELSKLKDGNRLRKFCVQYGESDFGFVCRLMEEEGIYYYYRHSDDNHELILCDSPGAHTPGQVSSLAYVPMTASIANVDSLNRFDSIGAYIQDWREHVTTGGQAMATLSDFDFQKPDRPMLVATKDQQQHPGDEIEVYDYPGRFYEEAEGKVLSETSLAARRAPRRSYRGASRNGALAVGDKFELTEYKRFDGDYVLTHCRHSITAEAYRSGLGGGGGTIVHFEAIPAATVWKVPQTRPRPIVHGPETAIVTGPEGEKIYCDRYGRVKVQFHWDRDGKRDDNSSCWMRVSHLGGLGSLSLPRVDEEVLVNFINGDPDRPVIVGRLFNEAHMPPYPLPGNKTIMAIRSETYKDRSPSGAKKTVDPDDKGINEIRFEDMSGKEEFFNYAQRDMNTRIQRDETHHVGNDQDIDVGQDRTMQIEGNDTVHIGKGSNGGNRKTTIEKDETRTIKGDRETQITGTDLLHAQGNICIQSDSEIVLKVGSSKITITDGEISFQADKVLSEGNCISQLAVGGDFVVVSPSGVSVKGTMVLINSGGAKTKPKNGAGVMSKGGGKGKQGGKPYGGAKEGQSGKASSGKGSDRKSNPFGSDAADAKGGGSSGNSKGSSAGGKDSAGGMNSFGSDDWKGNKG